MAFLTNISIKTGFGIKQKELEEMDVDYFYITIFMLTQNGSKA